MGSDGGDVVLDPEPAVAGENKPFRHRVEKYTAAQGSAGVLCSRSAAVRR